MSARVVALIEEAGYLIGCWMACQSIGDASAMSIYFDRAEETLNEAMRVACGVAA